MSSSTLSLPGSSNRSLVLEAARAEKAQRELARSRRQELVDNLEGIRERCKRLSGFIREAWHVLEPMTVYVRSWYHDALAEHLEAITRGEFNRLQINEPPRMAKKRKSISAPSALCANEKNAKPSASRSLA